MTNDDKALVERLRGVYRVKVPNYIDDAADRIEAQAAEIEKLREALEYYADRNNHCPNKGPWGVDSTDFGLVALKALKAL